MHRYKYFNIIPLSHVAFVLAFLIQTSPSLSPHKLSGLLLLVDHALAFRTANSNGLTISADEAHTMTRVNSVLAKSAQFSSILKNKNKLVDFNVK